LSAERLAEQARVAIVVGASGGIGNAVALRLAKDGFAIVAHYAGNPAKVDEAVVPSRPTAARLSEPKPTSPQRTMSKRSI
jgi:NAD(P)-dependent dehydrogenase (short-subunit alcohol dehydrogenase family)